MNFDFSNIFNMVNDKFDESKFASEIGTELGKAIGSQIDKKTSDEIIEYLKNIKQEDLTKEYGETFNDSKKFSELKNIFDFISEGLSNNKNK